jgi:hypothetical protein
MVSYWVWSNWLQSFSWKEVAIDLPGLGHRTIATLETQNFSFIATSSTAFMAETALRKGFEEHAAQVGIHSNWWRQYRGSIHIDKCPTGGCLRDHAPIATIKDDEGSEIKRCG